MPGNKKKKAEKEPLIKKGKTIALRDTDIARLEKEVRILREVAEVTNRDFNLNEVLGRLLDICMEASQADAGSMLLLDRPSGVLYFAAARGKKAEKVSSYKL
ncbi:MAG TPA: hypothetical protein P5511_07710, partial [Candidatus Goldiibacteriota bacterium]|nr:hypothetical protein [Candidatus Goldiibacteriota bacterium]